MRPYGVRIIEEPDVADIQDMAAKSSCGRLPEKGGDFKGYSRSRRKRARRRYWKRKARREGRAFIAAAQAHMG